MTVQVGEGELRSWVRTLTAADQPGARRPAGEVDEAGQLCDPGPLARLAVTVDRRAPGILLKGEDLLAHRLADGIAQRKLDPRLPAAVREGMARTGRVRAREDLTVEGALRQLLEGELERLEVIS